jgi:hypothetical protein
VHDVDVSGPPVGRNSGPIPCPGPPARSAGPADDDDEILGRVLIASWTLATGRRLRDDVRPQFLSEEELISFWADEQMSAAEQRPRHARLRRAGR